MPGENAESLSSQPPEAKQQVDPQAAGAELKKENIFSKLRKLFPKKTSDPTHQLQTTPTGQESATQALASIAQARTNKSAIPEDQVAELTALQRKAEGGSITQAEQERLDHLMAYDDLVRELKRTPTEDEVNQKVIAKQQAETVAPQPSDTPEEKRVA